MHYYSYDLPSAVTEERLASVVCASVKDYLSGGTDYVAALRFVGMTTDAKLSV